MKKRGREDVQPKARKRFVWPDNLHRSFIAAVFDVGLRAASAKAVRDVLPAEFLNLSIDQIEGQLNKFKLHWFHQSKNGEKTIPSHSLTQDEIDGISNRACCHGDIRSGTADPAADLKTETYLEELSQFEGERNHKVQKAQIRIKEQAVMIERSLDIFSNLQQELGNAQASQLRIYNNLSDRVRQVVCIPDNIMLSDPGNSHQQPRRAQMEKEMQNHMSMHRTMVTHMDHQLAQFDVQRSDDIEHTSFEENFFLDGNLFDFLRQ